MKQLSNVIIENKFPQIVFNIGDIYFSFDFDMEPFLSTVDGIVSYFEKIIIVHTKFGKSITGQEFLQDLPAPFLFLLLEQYQIKRSAILEDLSKQEEAFYNSNQSKYLWKVFKNAQPERVLTISNKLNIFQQNWVVFNSSQDDKDLSGLIFNIFDALKPWLNNELYHKVKQREENTRTNKYWDDDNMDERLQQEAQNMFKKSKTLEEDDLDIIEIEKSNG